MARRFERMMTRAAGVTKPSSFKPALGNQKSPGGNLRKGQVAATAGITYVSEGQPLRLNWTAQQAARTSYLGSVWVMQCVRVIANTIAGLPWVAGPDPTNPAVFNPSAPLARFLGPATPQAPGGPNPQTAARAFWAWSIIQYLVTGRFAWEAQLTGTGKTKALVGLWPLVSAALLPIPSVGGTKWFDGFQYRPATGQITLRPEQVIYCWNPSIEDWRLPESALQAAMLPIFIQRSIDTYMANLLKNDMVATTMVISPPFDESAARRAWQDQFLSEFTGVNNVGGTIFGEMEGDETTETGKPLVQVERLATTPVDAQLSAVQQQAKIDITIALGVPESLIGNASQRTYANADSEYKNFWTITILPLLSALQDHVNNTLAPRIGMTVGWFDLSRVVALRPPSIFAPPTITSVIATGVASPQQIANVLGIPAANATTDADTTTVNIGEETAMGAAGGEGGGGGGGRSVSPLQIPPGERRATLNRWLAEAARRQSSGWRPEDEIMNSHTLQRGHLIHRKRDNRIELRSEGQSQAPRAPQPDSMPRASTSVGGGFQQAERIRQHAMEVRALATANRLTKKVHDYLARNYPESTLGWVGDAEWDGPKHVKLSDIDMARRPGGRDQSKVQGIARAMTQDPSGALVNEPVVLVKVPGSDKLVVADGYHRTLAHKRVGHGRVLGYVGTVDQTEGPWDREMHDKKINREDEPTSVEVPTVETIDAWVAQHEAELEAMLP